MFDFAQVPEFWLGAAAGLITGMILLALMLLALDAAEFGRHAGHQLPPRSGKGRTWPAANDPTGPIERPRSARSEHRSRPR